MEGRVHPVTAPASYHSAEGRPLTIEGSHGLSGHSADDLVRPSLSAPLAPVHNLVVDQSTDRQRRLRFVILMTHTRRVKHCIIIIVIIIQLDIQTTPHHNHNYRHSFCPEAATPPPLLLELHRRSRTCSCWAMCCYRTFHKL